MEGWLFLINTSTSNVSSVKLAKNMVYLSSQCCALGRVFRIAQIFAVFPFRLNQDGLYLEPVLLVYVMVMKLAMGVHFLMGDDPTRRIGAVTAYLAVLLNSIIVFFKKDQLNVFFKLLSECEFSFIQLGKKSVIKTNDLLDSLLVAFNVLASVLDSINRKDMILVTFFKVWLSVNIVIAVHPFFHLVFVMQRLFSNLNEMVQSPSHFKASRFHHLVELHQRCITACIVLNGCFTEQVLWITGATFLYLTMTCYKVFSVIEGGAGLIVVAVHVFNLVYFISIAYLVCALCERTSAEAKKFDILLHRLIISDVTGELVSDEKLFLHIAMRQELSFSANNVFAVDNTLIHSMISTASTYLVILIQIYG